LVEKRRERAVSHLRGRDAESGFEKITKLKNNFLKPFG
jgi:hypothetical protein